MSRIAHTTRAVIGAAIPTVESLRLVRGQGQFVDDIELAGLVHAHVLRSPYPHARIRSIDLSAARLSAGVHLVICADDLGVLGRPVPMLFDDPAILHPRSHVPLAREIVRYAGEPVAFIVAESRAAAEDAAELVVIEYEPLDAVGSLEIALQPGSPLVHDDVPGNIAGSVREGYGLVDAAMQGAVRIVRRIRMERGASIPIETRGIVAAPEPAGPGLDIWASTQRPVKLRDGLADFLGRPLGNVRVRATDVGGGFGPKGMFMYPEELLVAWAATRLGRPVKWIEDRLEHFSATSQLREQIHDIELAIRSDGTLLALRDHFVHDGGAYVPYGLSVPRYTAATLTGPYRIPATEVTYDVVYTNRPPTCPYRGSGGPFATFVIERAFDAVAAELGLDPLEVRRRNVIAAADMPFDSGIPFADGRPIIHDGTPYEQLLDAVVERFDRPGLTARRTDALGRGRCLGVGFALYTEATGLRSFEGARVIVEPSGRVSVAVGTSSQGQGHETTLAQIVADRLNVGLTAVVVTQGDTAAFGAGRGTYGSKVAVVVGSAVLLAADRVRDRALAAVAASVGRAPSDFELRGGCVEAIDGSSKVPLGEVARRLRYEAGGPEAPATGPGLEATAYFAPERASIGGGAHGCEVEVDPETGEARVVRYVVATDSGTVLNPGIVEGQIRGGIAQGIGGALLERLVWDGRGVLINGTLMDYLIPRVDDVPRVEFHHLDSPSPTNPLGIKGVGEAGIFPVSAAVCSALEDALGCAESAPFLDSPVMPEAIRARAAAIRA